MAKVMTQKDRPGHLPRPKAAELELTSDPVSGLITWEIRAGADLGRSPRDSPLRKRLSRKRRWSTTMRVPNI
jgi:hypothetical protein